MGIETLLIATAVAGTAATVASTVQSNKASRAASAASAAQQRQAQVQATRERRSAIRQNILARAQLSNRATIAGVSDSSGYAGGLGSAASQFGANLGFSGQMSGLTNQIFSLQQSQIRAQGLSQLYGGIGQVAFGAAQSFANPSSFLSQTVSNGGVTVGGPNSLFGGNSWG